MYIHTYHIVCIYISTSFVIKKSKLKSTLVSPSSPEDLTAIAPPIHVTMLGQHKSPAGVRGGGSTYNPNTWEAEAGGSPVQGQPVLHGETCVKTKSKTEILLE
jgi:hypothetical protein